MKSNNDLTRHLNMIAAAAAAAAAGACLMAVPAYAQSAQFLRSQVKVNAIGSALSVEGVAGSSRTGSVGVGVTPFKLDGSYQEQKTGLEGSIDNGVIRVKNATVTDSTFDIYTTLTNATAAAGGALRQGVVDIQ